MESLANLWQRKRIVVLMRTVQKCGVVNRYSRSTNTMIYSTALKIRALVSKILDAKITEHLKESSDPSTRPQ